MKADHTPAELQKYWDACLIRGWREFQQISDVVFAYQSIAIGWDVPTAGIRRMPQYGMPWSTSSRAFVASYLPKISDRLWNQTRDRDVYLLKALQKSTYDIQKQVRDVTLAEVMRDVRTVKAKNEFTTRLVSTRNASTDWGVCKATRRQRTG